MSKVMIVEDDDSLREIYAIRLTAEGYAVVSARDGEEALAVAVKERPDLIISDVMMPKISGFDMLDILRSTPETQNIRVIMMTALSSEDQRVRGENLGADRYIVKSQVGIEDVVNVVHEVLGDRDPNSGTIDTQAPVEVPAMQPQAPVADMTMRVENTQVVPGVGVVAQPGTSFAPMDQITNVPTQAMPPAEGTAEQARIEQVSVPSEGFTPAEQVTNIPTQVMPPADGGAEQPAGQAMSALGEMPDQPTAVPPSIMPPASTGL